METTLHVLGTAVVVAAWLAPAFLLAFCATCDGCARLFHHFRAPPRRRAVASGTSR